MKTLLMTIEYPPFKGGVANYYGHLADYWPIADRLIVWHDNDGKLLDRRSLIPWLPACGRLSRRLRKGDIDYVLVGHLLPLGTVAWIVSYFRSFRYGVFLHGMDFNWALRSERKAWVVEKILARADRIICANSRVAALVRDKYPDCSGSVSVVNPGISAGSPFFQEEKIAELNQEFSLQGKTVLLSLGRLVRRKGFDHTIRAIAGLPAEMKDKLVYVIAGSGPEEPGLRQLAAQTGLKNVIFLGEVSEADKWLWLNRCDIFIMPAREIAGDFEGFGIVYLEANLCSRPVIAGRSGGVPDAVAHETSGLLVNPDSIEDIQRAIMRLLGDPELARRLGAQGRERAIRDFSWEKQAGLVSSLIKGSL